MQFRGQATLLSSSLGTYSVYDPRRLFTGFSWDALSLSGTLLSTPPRRILLLGKGGGTVVRQCRYLYPDAHIDAVEIDPLVIRAARAHFHLPRSAVRVFQADAASFLRRSFSTYDMVLDDVWMDNPGFVKFLFADDSYPDVVHHRVSDRGLYAVNLWCRPPAISEVRRAARRLGRHFSVLVALRPSLGPTGVLVLLCYK
ncbi:MAG TPA: fused MFS/spermidine synthase [Bryobacteraceae bacterium]|nr:fused MFS/spermidine synthase [Bryobacteraceae bacterium]